MISITSATQSIQAPAPISPTTWTPESVLIFIGLCVIGGLVSLVAWLGKKQLDTIIKNQSDFINRQVTCREELPVRFSDKKETAEHIRELYTRTDRHEQALTRHDLILERREDHRV